MTPEDFRKLGHALVDWVASYRENVSQRPVMSQVSPGAIRALFPAQPPEVGGDLSSLFARLNELILPGITHWSHPAFFAYFPSNTSLASVLADLLTAGLGIQGMSWQTSPAATEVEEVMMDWLRQAIGLSASFTGVIHDTASTATLVALLCARERATSFSQNRSGLQRESRRLIVYASDQAHSSVDKAAMLAGFGRENIRLIESDEQHALRVDRLKLAVEEDKLKGHRPCAIIATVGSTATTAIDPIAPIAEVARELDCWLHVDAAMAGTAMILPECRSLWQGVELADSLVLNPHKWLGAGFDCSAYYVRDPQHLIRVMSTHPSYLRTAQDNEVKNFRDWGIPLGRRFRALKLWFVFHEQGLSGLRKRIRRDLDNAQWLAKQVEQSKDWKRIAPVPFQTVSLRYAPDGCPSAELDSLNMSIAQRVNATGRAYVTPAVVKGTQIIRVSIGTEATERHHVEAAWNLLQQTARELDESS